MNAFVVVEPRQCDYSHWQTQSSQAPPTEVMNDNQVSPSFTTLLHYDIT